MKKTFIYLVVFLFTYLSGALYAQNLVINPSFENNTGSCSGIAAGEGFSQVVDWDNANSNTPGDSCSSPDLFSPCNVMPIVGGPSPTFAPNSWLGYQCAKTGTRYAGIITNEMGGIGGSYREYIQGRLSAPLQAGETYCISFYISLGDATMFATNNIGVAFTNSHYLRDACAAGSLITAVTPQLNYDCQPIMDTEWMRLQWDYVAAGGESYIIIGNFSNDANTQVVSTGFSSPMPNPYAYYFIDEVSVTAGSCCFAEILPPVINSCSTAGGPSGTPIASFCITDPAATLNIQTGENCSPSTPNGTWAGPGISSTGVFTPATAGVGTHTITYTLPCGYVATTTVEVLPCDLEVCVESDGSLTVSGGTGPYSWQSETTTQDCSGCLPFPPGNCDFPPGCAVMVTQWTDFATGTTIPAPSGYPIRVVDGGGNILTINSAASLASCGSDPCTASTLAVSINPTNVSCNGLTDGLATATATGGTAPYTYSWNTSPAQNTEAATGLGVGSYTVTVTDDDGCTATATTTINAPNAIILSTDSTQTQCGATTGTATVTVVSGGTAPFTYSWNTSPIQTTATATGLGAGSYTVTVTDDNNCTETATVTISDPGGLTLSTDSTQAQCGANTGTATVTVVSGGVAPFTYSWNTSPVQNTATATGLGVGSYTVTVTDDNDCEAQESVTITAQNAPSVSIVSSQNVSCFGQSDGSAEVEASGGTPGYTYTWSTGAIGSSASNLPAGTHTVIVVDNASCSTQVDITITEPDVLSVTEIINHASCGADDGSIALAVSGGNGGYSYIWTPNVSSTNVASNLAIGNYSVLITDALGCSVSRSFNVQTGATFHLEASPEISIINAGESVGLTVDVDPNITVDAVTWTPTGGLSCTSCYNPTASPSTSTTYYVTVIDENGCIASDSVTVIVREPCGELFIPTIFSPNDDGQNDFECVMGGCILTLEFTIYNRWGEVVFTTDNQANCWDGTFRGKPVQTGVYVYKLNATLSTGDSISESGNINVIR